MDEDYTTLKQREIFSIRHEHVTIAIVVGKSSSYTHDYDASVPHSVRDMRAAPRCLYYTFSNDILKLKK